MAEVKNIPVTLKRDYTLSAGKIDKSTGLIVDEIRKAGETIMVSREEAQRLLAHDAADRADPLP